MVVFAAISAGWDLCASVFILKSASDLQYFSITSCNSMRVVAGFLASLEEHSPDLESFTIAKMTTSSVMFTQLNNLC